MMERTEIRFRARVAWWFMMLPMVMLGGVAGCATTRTDLAGDVIVGAIWKVRDQFVAIEKQDRQMGVPVPANAHPANISVELLRSALVSIEVMIPGKDEAVQLFHDPELKILSENIRKGLVSAGSDEDITFAVIGNYTVLLGVLQERKVTTGRVFCQDGQLNIIFGDVLRDVRENEDRRLYPFLPGSRAAAVARKWALTAKPGGEIFTTKRPDWVTFHLTSPATSVVAPATPAVTLEKPATQGKKNAEERLMILNDLWRKTLITEEEYRAKRLEILNEL